MYCINNQITILEGLIGLVYWICLPWTPDIWALRLAEVSTQKRLQNSGPSLKRCRGILLSQVEPLSCRDVGNDLYWTLKIKFAMQKEAIYSIDSIDAIGANDSFFLGWVFLTRIHIGPLIDLYGVSNFLNCRISFRPFRMIASTRRALDNCHLINLKHMKPTYENASPTIPLLQKDGMHKLALHFLQRSILLSCHFWKSKRSKRIRKRFG